MSPSKNIKVKNNVIRNLDDYFKSRNESNNNKEKSKELQMLEEDEDHTISKKAKENSRNKNKVKVYNFTKMQKVTEEFKDMDSEKNSEESLQTSTQRTSGSLGNLFKGYGELQSAIENSRQSFIAYKLNHFFHFDTDFIKNFGHHLLRTEQCIEKLGDILTDCNDKESSKPVVISSSPEDKKRSYELDIGELTSKVEISTPPASEVGNDDRDTSFDSVTNMRKRRLTATIANAVGEGCTRKRRSVLATNVVTKVHAEGKSPIKNPTNSSDKSPQQLEFEVRKVKDFISKSTGSYYQVSWKGYSSDDDTLEPSDHLDGCDDMLSEFFLGRLRKRQIVTQAEKLKDLILPKDNKYRDLLYVSFERLVHPISEDTRQAGIALAVSSKCIALRTREEILDDIQKLVVIKDPSNDRYKRLYKQIIEQISYKEILKERQKQLAHLRNWERTMDNISTDPGKLAVENNVDLALPPFDFIYINKYKAGPGIVIPENAVAGCECLECDVSQKGCCAEQWNSYFPYNKNGRVRVSLGTPIYECNKACKCSSKCITRVVQKGRIVSLAIFRTENGRGWGVRALEAIKKGQFVSEYVGEVITSDEAEVRGRKYDKEGVTYLFDLDFNKGDLNPYTVDAMKYGNVSHFINHSCDPNLGVYNVWIDCLDPDLPKLALFAIRDIKKGEEISFDYNSGCTRQTLANIEKSGESTSTTPQKDYVDGVPQSPSLFGIFDVSFRTPKSRSGKTECRCGAPNCRKYFF